MSQVPKYTEQSGLQPRVSPANSLLAKTELALVFKHSHIIFEVSS